MERKCINCKLNEAVNETYDALEEGWIEPELSSVLDYFVDKLLDKGLIPVDDVLIVRDCNNIIYVLPDFQDSVRHCNNLHMFLQHPANWPG